MALTETLRAPMIVPFAEDHLDGAYFLLDSYVRGHFGHALTDQLGHVWGWSMARARHPEVRALLFAEPGGSLAEWELTLLEASGVPRDRVVIAHRPTRVDTLLCTSPMFGMPEYVHPSIATTYPEWVSRSSAISRS